MISTELNRIIGAKDAIRASIIGKGVQVPSSATIDDYSAYIDLIQQCSGNTSGSTMDITTPQSHNILYYRCANPAGRNTSIPESAFTGCHIISNTYVNYDGSIVTNVQHSSVTYTQGMGTIVFDNNITEIRGETFGQGQTPPLTLTEIHLPDGLLTLGADVFKDCWALKFLDIPDSVTGLSASAITNCNSMSSITIGSGVTTIDGESFLRGCSGLTSITFGKSITDLGNLFEENISLVSLNTMIFKSPTAPTITYHSTPYGYTSWLEKNLPSTGTIYAPQGSDYSGISALIPNWTLTYV